MNKIFEGFTMIEFIKYLRNNDTLQFNDIMECSLIEDNDDPNVAEISYWYTYDHNNINVLTVIDFFNEFGN